MLRRTFVAALSLLVLGLIASASALAYHETDGNDGKLDPDFGSGGIAATSFTGFGYDANGASGGDIARQPDGKLVAVGDQGRRCCDPGSDIVLSRYNRDGSLDLSFGDPNQPGRQRTIVPATSYAIAEAVALQPDGKIVVAGWNRVGFGNPHFMVMRYHANGALDTSFDGGGDGAGIVTTYNVGPTSKAYDVLVAPDGKIVVAGWTQGTGTGGGLEEGFAVVRYNPNGTLDTSFDGDGIARVLRPSVHTDTGSAVMDGAQGIVRDPGGDLVVAGSLPVASAGETESRLAAARFSPGGAPVATFGTGEVPGVAFANSNDVPAHGRALVRDPAGSGFIVAGYLDATVDEPAITRFSDAGAFDASFGFVSQQFSNSAGTAVSAQYNDVAVDPSHGLTNRVVAFGTVGTDNFSGLGREFLFSRYAGGLLDQGNFSATGYNTVKIAEGSDGAALVVQPDGRYVGFGTASGNGAAGFPYGSLFGLARLGAHPPRKVTDPTISGTAEVGQQLTLNPGEWEYDPDFQYQWLRCDASDFPCTNIVGATAATYTVTSADGGKWIRAQVNASNGSGTSVTGPALSQSLGPVAQTTVAPPSNTAAPTISGTPRQGEKLTASNGTWTNNPTGYAYQWQRCTAAGATCASYANVGGASSQTYTLAAGDVGYLMRVVVTASNSGGATPKDSAPAGPVEAPPAAAPSNTAAPAVSGTAKQGETLSATSGSWTNTPTAFTYQWQRCSTSGEGCTSFANIEGATGATYGLGAADVGRRIRVLVTASNAGGSAAAESAPTAPVAATTPIVKPKPPAPQPQPKPSAFTAVDTTRTARMPKVVGKPVDTAIALIDKNIFSDVTIRYTHKYPGKREPDTGDVVVQKPAAYTPITSSAGDLQNVVLEVYAGPKPRGDDRCPEDDLKRDLKKLEQGFAEEVLRRARCKFEVKIVPSDNVSEPTTTKVAEEGKNELEITQKVPTDPEDNDLFLAFNDNPNGAGFNAEDWTLKAPSGGGGVKNAFSVTVVDRSGRLVTGAEIVTDIRGVVPGDFKGQTTLKDTSGELGRGKADRAFTAYNPGKIHVQAKLTVGDKTLFGIGTIQVEKQSGDYVTTNGDTVMGNGVRAKGSASDNVFQQFVTWLQGMVGFGPSASALNSKGTARDKIKSAASGGKGAYPVQLAFGDPLSGGNSKAGLQQVEVTFLTPDGQTAKGLAWVIAAGGGNVIAAGGGNVIAAGGGNVIAAGGGNVIAAGGGNVIAAGGGNLMFQEVVVKGGKVIAAGGGNVIAAGGGNVIAAGGGNVIAAGGGNLTTGGNVIAAGGGNVIAPGALN